MTNETKKILDEKIDAQIWLALALVASGIFLINRR